MLSQRCYAILLVVKLMFDEVKATQAAAKLLQQAGGSLSYMALIKLLYRADREAIRRWGLPITTDKYVSMKCGPVTSTIYNRIKASREPSSHPTFWSSHIEFTGNHAVGIKVDPGDSELSIAEEKLLLELFALEGKDNQFKLADKCHREFPEWTDPGNSSTPIELADIIEALDLSEDEADQVEKLVSKQKALFQLTNS
jgi:uncharacterized phage-associated protein